MPYLAYTLPEDARDKILSRFPTSPGMEPVCHHVTRAFPAQKEPAAPVGEAARLEVVGRFTGEHNDVLVVAVDGEIARPTGGFYHLTLAVDRARGGTSAGSNRVLREAAASEGPAALWNLPHTLALPNMALGLLPTDSERKKASEAGHVVDQDTPPLPDSSVEGMAPR